MDLIVSYYWNQFFAARREVIRVLREFGDSAPQVERTSVAGIAIVHTSLDNRLVVEKCKEEFAHGKEFRFAIKWVLVDFWCETTLESMKETIEREVLPRIGENETWGMKVEKRRWHEYHSIDIIRYLAVAINRKVNLDDPDKLVRIDVVGKQTAISVLRPGETFSINVPTL